MVVVETANDRFIKKCQQRYPLHRYERLAPLMHELRMIKEPEEIKIMQHACDITEAGFRRLLGFVKPGVGEWEVEAELLHEFVRRGSRGFAYQPIIGSGKNACVLHYITNEAVCQDGEMLLLDVAAEYAGWASDLTRTIPVNGRFTKRQRDVFSHAHPFDQTEVLVDEGHLLTARFARFMDIGLAVDKDAAFVWPVNAA